MRFWRAISISASAALLLALTAFPGVAVAAPAPVISSLSSYASPVGTIVTIKGTSFGSAKSTSYVTFDGASAKAVLWTDTFIVVTVPDDATPGYVAVVVGGVTSNGVYFVPAEPPTILGLSASASPPGTNVTISGRGFGASKGLFGRVTFAGVSAAIVSWSDTNIVATVPANAPGGYLGVWQNLVCSNGMWFVPDGAPAISNLSEGVTIVGNTVTVAGSNFGVAPPSGDALTLGGLPITPDSWSDTTIRFKVPRGGRSGYVGVWKQGIASNGAFMIVGPKVDSLASWWGQPASQLKITGEGFGATPDRVTLAGALLPIISWNDSQIVVSVPAGAAEGYLGVWLGEGCSNGKWFLPITQPQIASVDTTSVTAGTTITVTGADFDTRTAYSQVTIGGADLDIVSWSDTKVVATVRAGTPSGYLGIWKKGVASNGVWIQVAP